MGVFSRKDKDKVERWYGSYSYGGRRFAGYPLRRWMSPQREPATRKEAIAALERFRQDVRDNKALDGGPTYDGSMSFGAFITFYREHYVAERRKVGKMRGSDTESVLAIMERDPVLTRPTLHAYDGEKGIGPLLAFLGRLRSEVLSVTVTKKDGRKKTVSLHRKRQPATVDKFIIRLHSMFKYAKTSGYIVKSPFECDANGQLAKQATGEARCRRVTPAEEKALLAQADPIMQDRLVVALATGVRRGELQNMQFKQIDMTEGKLFIPGTRKMKDADGCDVDVKITKSGKGRTVWLSPEATTVMKRRLATVRAAKFGKAALTATAEQTLRDAFVFGTDAGHKVISFRKALATMLRNAKLDKTTLESHGKMKFDWHDLRGECCTRLLESGVPAAAVQQMMGHADLQTTIQNYTGTLENVLRKAVQG